MKLNVKIFFLCVVAFSFWAACSREKPEAEKNPTPEVSAPVLLPTTESVPMLPQSLPSTLPAMPTTAPSGSMMPSIPPLPSAPQPVGGVPVVPPVSGAENAGRIMMAPSVVPGSLPASMPAPGTTQSRPSTW